MYLLASAWNIIFSIIFENMFANQIVFILKYTVHWKNPKKLNKARTRDFCLLLQNFEIVFVSLKFLQLIKFK